MSILLPPYPFIREKLRQGLVIPFLGAGASLGGRPAGGIWKKDAGQFPPKSSELAEHLAHITNFPSDDKCADLAKIAQYFEVATGRVPLKDELRSIFCYDYNVSALHEYLAEIPAPLLIVTTNYDDLIERAFYAKGRSYDVVIHTTDQELGENVLWQAYGEKKLRAVLPNKLYIDISKVTVIYKMHGAINRDDSERDQFVITEDDYIDFLVRITKNKAIPSIFAEPFQKRHFLFLGYSLKDWNLRVALSRIEKDLRLQKIKSWSIQDSPSPVEQRFWQGRGVDVFDMTIESFLNNLKK